MRGIINLKRLFRALENRALFRQAPAVKTIQKQLLEWYRANRRDLPWRRSKDPYAIMLSEIMLQQTTVRVVIPYFEKFLKEFPTVKDLAAAPEDRVMALWSGLGYYSRARNLLNAAKVIAELGAFPGTYEELIKLPGIGPYTAAAIASIAFDQEIAAVDGNVIRVVSRLFDVSHDVGSREGKAAIAELATRLVSGQPGAEHNQAMMELGATVCVAANPVCLLCPLMKNCHARRNQTVLARPVKKKNRRQEPWLWEMYLVRKGGKIALVRENNGTPWLKNTWVLPGRARRLKGDKVPRSDFKHSITHHKIFVKIHEKSEYDLQGLDCRWINPRQLDSLGVSSVVQKALTRVQNMQGD
jgi:A/G-specific adenine glycosylase